ncbi:MAG: hypothetical protein EZS28_016090 [Streblomastix strix]|uniref:Uncharacterized protein n=1 Tax=Streblomastix strix TaxID=222440 RepID=A0A5J4W1Q5_9EUKA|nr:MAG: hypothetical protein EZS28_016090 [Streblomastix strix]
MKDLIEKEEDEQKKMKEIEMLSQLDFIASKVKEKIDEIEQRNSELSERVVLDIQMINERIENIEATVKHKQELIDQMKDKLNEQLGIVDNEDEFDEDKLKQKEKNKNKNNKNQRSRKNSSNIQKQKSKLQQFESDSNFDEDEEDEQEQLDRKKRGRKYQSNSPMLSSHQPPHQSLSPIPKLSINPNIISDEEQNTEQKSSQDSEQKIKHNPAVDVIINELLEIDDNELVIEVTRRAVEKAAELAVQVEQTEQKWRESEILLSAAQQDIERLSNELQEIQIQQEQQIEQQAEQYQKQSIEMKDEYEKKIEEMKQIIQNQRNGGNEKENKDEKQKKMKRLQNNKSLKEDEEDEEEDDEREDLQTLHADQEKLRKEMLQLLTHLQQRQKDIEQLEEELDEQNQEAQQLLQDKTELMEELDQKDIQMKQINDEKTKAELELQNLKKFLSQNNSIETVKLDPRKLKPVLMKYDREIPVETNIRRSQSINKDKIPVVSNLKKEQQQQQQHSPSSSPFSPNRQIKSPQVPLQKADMFINSQYPLSPKKITVYNSYPSQQGLNNNTSNTHNPKQQQPIPFHTTIKSKIKQQNLPYPSNSYQNYASPPLIQTNQSPVIPASNSKKTGNKSTTNSHIPVVSSSTSSIPDSLQNQQLKSVNVLASLPSYYKTYYKLDDKEEEEEEEEEEDDDNDSKD